jgi:hypothetical protein
MNASETNQALEVTMCAVVTVAGIFAEALVRKGLLSVEDAQGALNAVAQEIRDDGGPSGQEITPAASALASEIDKRSLRLKD